MKKLLRYLKYYKKESILGPLFKLLEASFELFVPLVVANIIDKGISAGDKRYIFTNCGMLILLGAVGLVSSLTAQYFSAKASVGFTTRIRSDLFTHIGKLSYSQLDEIGTSTLITRLTGDMNQVQSGLNLTLRLVLRSPFVVFGAMIMAFTVDVKSALIFAVVIPLLFAVVFAIMLVTIPMYTNIQKSLDGVLAKTRENLTGTRVIRAFCKENDEIKEFNDKNDALNILQIAVSKISVLLNPATFFIINAAVIALIYTGAVRVDSGSLSQGSVVALYNYMAQILVELIKLASLIISVTKSIACADRIQSVLDIEPCMASGSSKGSKNSDYAVEFKNVALKYSSAADEAVSDISFKVKRSSTVGIIGSTGSGKTTLMNMIPRFYDATSGSVEVFGSDVRDYDIVGLRAKIAVVPQKAALFKGTVRDNILMGNGNADDGEIYEALERAQAREIVDSKPGGLDFVIEQDSKNLSGGQRQRLTIARALVKKPEILILDDSASALDYATEANLRKALRGLEFDPTVFIVSQRAGSVMQADMIIVMDDGRIVGIGTSDELLKNCEVYREIYNTQFSKTEAEQ